jgi:hypothetical protein
MSPAKEMKVLVLGLPRTGTQCKHPLFPLSSPSSLTRPQALAEALEILGISPIYHMREVAVNAHQALWISAIRAKFEQGQTLTKQDFDQILSDFEVFYNRSPIQTLQARSEKTADPTRVRATSQPPSSPQN